MAARVLVVEDDPHMSNLLRLILEEEGHEVATAENGKVALAMVDGFAPHVILLDLKMPVMNGRDFALAYRARTPKPVPIAVVSAADDMHQRVADMGVAACLEKPFRIEDVVILVSTLLESPDIDVHPP